MPIQVKSNSRAYKVVVKVVYSTRTIARRGRPSKIEGRHHILMSH